MDFDRRHALPFRLEAVHGAAKRECNAQATGPRDEAA